MGCGPSKPTRVSPQKNLLIEQEKSRRHGGKMNSGNGKSSINNGDAPGIRTKTEENRITERNVTVPGAIMPPIERTQSQVEFFRLLEEKINQGQDLEETEHSI